MPETDWALPCSLQRQPRGTQWNRSRLLDREGQEKEASKGREEWGSLGQGPGGVRRLCSESREGRKVRSWLRAGKAGSRQGNMLSAELGRRRKNQRAGCRKGVRRYRVWAGLLLCAEHRGRGLTLCVL